MNLLESLPYELLCRITDFLTRNRKDLANCRLVSPRLGEAATRLYFETVPLYPHFKAEVKKAFPMSNDIKYDAHYFKNILDCDDLRKLVKRVDVYTCNPDCDHQPIHDEWSEENSPRNGMVLDITWWECFKRLPELQNLRTLSINFDRHGSPSEYDIYTFQTRPDRSRWVRHLFNLPGLRMKELCIRNFEDDLDQKEKNTERRESILRGLESLRMSMVTPQLFDHEDDLLKGGDGGHIHRVWAQFPARWLTPAKQLKRLVLYCDMPIGFFPKFDLRNVRFESLESLTFGQLIFSHDWQFDWILSHRSLKELCLDHCSILHQIGFAETNWLTEDGYPRFPNPDGWSDYPSSAWPDEDNFETLLRFVPYETRWHHVFVKFRNNLSQLRIFRFGSSSQWKSSPQKREYSFQPDPPIMPWEAELDLPNELFDARYLHYDDWKGGLPYAIDWETNQERRNWESREAGTMHPGMNPSPACDDEDGRALADLLQTLASR